MKPYRYSNLVRALRKRGPDRVSRRRKKRVQDLVCRWGVARTPYSKSWYVSMDHVLKVIFTCNSMLRSSPLDGMMSFEMDPDDARLYRYQFYYQLLVLRPPPYSNLTTNCIV